MEIRSQQEAIIEALVNETVEELTAEELAVVGGGSLGIVNPN